MKFGISFTATLFNQAGALVLMYRDGSVQVNHGGTEMGQGLHTKIAADRGGGSGRHAGSDSRDADAHGQSSQHVGYGGVGEHGSEWRRGVGRVHSVAGTAARRWRRDCCSATRAAVRFSDGQVYAEGAVEEPIAFRQVCDAAYRQRVSLFAQGYYRTPEIHYDAATLRGRPFYYFVYGAAVSEVEVDAFTGDTWLLRADILEDAGTSRFADRRSRPDRRRIHSGRGLDDHRRAVVGREGPRRDGRSVHLQIAFVVRNAAGISTSISWSAPPNRAWCSAAKRWASRR